ncbi:(Fe-S)-binding protein [Sulfurivermis fontis]|uniref:(Fe-S)-binding protein n=1 Tax=Sulfurivermis fontis TaxID=1972068 RepID=UPI001E45260E|nr:(Fe-S)-binding protein [Sulfurivermis fontis]
MNLLSQILADADRCVLCGMCLPHCPTYGLSHNEAESPRGRISLMLAVARGQLEADAGLLGHLDRCLGCRACEAMCPSLVPYGRLLRNTREHLYRQEHSRLADTLATPARRKLLGGALHLFQASGLQKITQRLHLLGDSAVGRLLQGLPEGGAAPSLPEFTPAQGVQRGQVALFTGCTGDLLQRRLLHDARRLLSALGYAVHIPSQQGCCGALHVQQGDGATARHLAQQNLAAFPAEAEAILSVASGCGALLHEYDDLLEDERAAGFARRVIDINAFLAGLDWPETLVLRPLPQKVAVHESCTLRNVLRGQQALYTLLRHIPQLEVVELPHNERCCGAAGSYLVDHPAEADTLRADKVAAVAELQPQWLASANIGCAMHLAAGLRAAGLAVEVVHPVSLLVKQVTSDK